MTNQVGMNIKPVPFLLQKKNLQKGIENKIVVLISAI